MPYFYFLDNMSEDVVSNVLIDVQLQKDFSRAHITSLSCTHQTQQLKYCTHLRFKDSNETIE